MKLRALTSLLFSSLICVGSAACSGQSASDDASSADGALSSADKKDVQKSAKDTIASAMKLDAKGKFTNVKFKDARGKSCFEIISTMLPDSKSSDLKHVHLHAVGSDAVAARAAAEVECSVGVIFPGVLHSSCNVDPSSVVVHELDKSVCDHDRTFVGLVGDDDKGEAALNGHHHYDEYKKGSLVIGGDDPSEDD